MPWARWKQVEKHFARRWGGERAGPTGLYDNDLKEIDYPFAAEIKDRKALPKWLKDAVAQADEDNDGNGHPLVILHEARRHYDNDFIVMRVEDFERLYGIREEVEARLEELKSDG